MNFNEVSSTNRKELFVQKLLGIPKEKNVSARGHYAVYVLIAISNFES
jgi:hypothetical protein